MSPVVPGPAHASPADVARRTAAVLAVAVAFGLGLYFVYSVRTIILWVVVAAMLAVALEPAVEWLVARGMGRTPAAILASAVTILVVVGILALVVTPLALQARQLVNELPRVVYDITRPGSPLHFLETRYHVVERVQHPTPGDFRLLLGSRHSLTSAITTTLSIVAAVLSVFVIMVLLLLEGPRSWRGFLSLLREEQRDRAALLGDRMQRAVGGYVRGNLFISLIAGSAAWLAMLLLGVPYPVPLGVMVGILDIVPLVGASIAALICVLVALSQGWLIALILLIFFLVYQQVENNVLQPVIYSKTVSLSPLTVLVAGLAGAAVAGLVGVLIAIPLASAGYILVEDLIERRQEEVAETDAEAEEELPGELAAAAAKTAAVDAPTASELGEKRGGIQTLRDSQKEGAEDAEERAADADQANDAARDGAEGDDQDGADDDEEEPPVARVI